MQSKVKQKQEEESDLFFGLSGEIIPQNRNRASSIRINLKNKGLKGKSNSQLPSINEFKDQRKQKINNDNESYCQGLDEEIEIDHFALQNYQIKNEYLRNIIQSQQLSERSIRKIDSYISEYKNKDNKQQNIEIQNDTIQFNQINDIVQEYNCQKKQDIFIDNYNISIIQIKGIESILQNYNYYFDKNKLLKIRKFIVLFIELLSLFCQLIIQSSIYRYFMLIIITGNIITVTVKYSYYMNQNDFQLIDSYIKYFLYFYSIELIMRMIAQNIIYFFNIFWNIFDFINVILLAFYVNNIIPFDFSPLRAMRILVFLSQIFHHLSISFEALIKSFKFMIEALFVVLIFCAFFANIGLHSFQYLFNNKCMNIQIGIIKIDTMCGWINCQEQDFYCVNIPNNFMPDSISNFNTFINSFISVIRTITMDDWADLMYLTLYTQNPFSWLYFVVIIFIVGFFAFNLIIAILKTHYSNAINSLEQNVYQQNQTNENENESINYQFIKELRLDEKLKIFKQNMNQIKAYQTFQEQTQQQLNSTIQNKSLPFLQTQNIFFSPENSFREQNLSIQQLFTKTYDRTKESKLKHILSARQKQEMENINNQNKIIQHNIIKFSIRNILLPQKRMLIEKKIIKGIQNIQEQQIFQQLCSVDILQWKKIIQYSEYHSNSINDILNQEQSINKKLQIELIKIQQKNIKQYYQLSQQEIKNLKKEQILIQKKLQKHYPLKKGKKLNFQKFHNKSENQSQFNLIGKSPKQVTGSSDKRRSSSFRMKYSSFQDNNQFNQMFNKLKFEFPEWQEGEQYILLNGIKWNYDSLKILINRKLDQYDEQQQYEQYQKEDQDQFYQYLKFRRKEVKKGYISTFNISFKNVNIKLDIKKQISILRSLNRIEKSLWILGLKGKLVYFRLQILWFIQNKIIILLFDVSILINFSIFCFIGMIEENIIDQIDIYLTIILSISIILQLIGSGTLYFSKQSSNVLDLIVLLLSLIKLLLQNKIPSLFNLSSQFKLLRASKSLLLYRIIKYNKFITRIMRIANITFKQYLSLTLLMFSTILIFAIFGMQFFIEHFQEQDGPSQLHSFKSVAKSWMTIFNITTNDDAIGMLKVVIQYQNKQIGIIYYLLTVFTNNYLIYGLVTAVLLDAFSFELQKQDRIEEDEIYEFQQNICIEKNMNQYNDESCIEIESQLYDENISDSKSISKSYPKLINHTQSNSTKITQQYFLNDQEQKFIYFNDVYCKYSCFYFTYHHKIRKICYFLSKSIFVRLIYKISIISSLIILIMEQLTLNNNNSYYNNICLLIANLLITIITIIDIISYGFILDKNSACQDIWKFINFIYLITYYISLINDSQLINYGLYLIYLRPLLFINIISSVNEIVDAMMKSLAKIINIIFVILLVFMVFNVFAIHLYSQQMGYCENFTNFGLNKQQCIDQQMQWINYPFNFDNFINGLLTLTVITSLDAWGEIMQVCYNANFDNYGPTPYNLQWSSYIFFIIFIFIGVVFFMGFLTGILFTEFQKYAKKLDNKNLTTEQSQFISVCQLILKQRPNYSHAPKSFIRRNAYKIITNKKYKLFYNSIIILNGLLLCMLIDLKNEYEQNLLNQIYQIFTIILALDCPLKLLAFGIIRYQASNWRKIEFIFTILFLTDFIIDINIRWFKEYTTIFIIGNKSYLYKLLLILRDIKIIFIFQEFKGIYRLLRVLFYSSPLLLKILYVQLIIQFTYALIGSNLFGHISKGIIIDDQYINFKNFLNSTLILFKCTSGDDWRYIFIDCTKQNPYCYEDSNQCGTNSAYFFFLTYYLFSNIIVMNLFVLALVNEFENFFNHTTNIIQKYVENVDHYCNCWCRYTFQTQGKNMHTRFIGRFFLDLGQPLGAQNNDNIWDVAKDAFNFRIKADKQGLVNFNELLYEIMRFTFYQIVFKEGSYQGKQEMKYFDLAMKKKLKENLNQTNEIKPKGSIDELSEYKYCYQNFNILQEYLQLLIVVKTWKAYSKRLFDRSLRGIEYYTENESENTSKINDADINVDTLGLNLKQKEKLWASQAIDESNKVELIRNFTESKQYRLTNSNTRNSSLGQQIIYEPTNDIFQQRSDSQGGNKLIKKSILKKHSSNFTLNDILNINQFQ